MASSSSYLPLSFSSSIAIFRASPNIRSPPGTPNLRFWKRGRSAKATITEPKVSAPSKGPPRLVTFLGKGGSGKTTAAVLAAQYYAKMGLQTCLVIQSLDLMSEVLLDCKIGSSPIPCGDNLSAVRLETTKMLLGPLSQMKKADARLNLTQGVLDGVVGEELGILPGMDSVLSLEALEGLTGLLGLNMSASKKTIEFDVIVYDGISSEESLRMVGASERARWYLKYIRSLAEKTDSGRLVAPSLIKLVNESVNLNGASGLDVASSEMWNAADRALKKASSAFLDPSRFSCYLTMDTSNSVSVISALRYWGCTIQAGGQVYGAFGFSAESSTTSCSLAKEKLAPLPFENLPYVSTNYPVNWEMALNGLSNGAQQLLLGANRDFQSNVLFDQGEKTVTLFMPGFDKSEIKLYQYRGGSELLVEAGDQRRVIHLPSGIQGKVRGAKFLDRNLVIRLG
ncbi:uncharacterized protein At1g26090, chloroplastic [Nymphaea colorata]|nr:uncharacterized protein At1g26090, chloroplastic [Nymphaea colorata]